MRLANWLSILAVTLPMLSATAYAGYPTRGMSMATVKAHYGEPSAIRYSAPPVKKRWPKITAWQYNGFTVYFERSTVLHTVVH
ncbi:MAG: hypothetical protein ACK4RS_04040 [Thiothrix sp.]